MKRIRSIFFLFLLISSVFIDLNAQPNLLITDIEFLGNQTLSKTELLDQMFTVPTSWFQRSILGSEPSYYNEKIFEEDLKNIIRVYQRNGYLNAHIIKKELFPNEEAKKIEIVLTIEENEPVRINSVQYKFIETFPITKHQVDSLTEVITGDINISKGQIFKDKLITKDEIAIYDKLLNAGYPHTLITNNLDVDTLENIVDLTWKIDTGPRSEFGEIFITGYERSSEKRIRNKLKFDKGDQYSQSQILKSQQRLYNQGFYYVAAFQATKKEDRTNSTIPIQLQIKESPLFRADFGLGYGRDEKFRVSANFRILGPWGTSSRINVEAKHSALEALKLSLIYTNPDIFDLETTLRIKTGIRRQTEPAFEAERKGIDFALMKEIFWNIYGSAMINLESVDMDSTSISYVNMGDGFLPNYQKTGLTLGLNKNEARPFFNPSSGYQLSYIFSYMGIAPKDPYNYNVNLAEIRKYFSLIPDRLIFAYKLNIGAIVSHDPSSYVPVEDKFFSGGSNSIRGWGRSELGPKDSNNKPIGGKSILENSAEFRLSLSNNIGTVLFLDFGNVWLTEFTYMLSDFRYSVGGGLRYSTPIGPIRFDIAVPVFESGGKIQFWFSVGQAF